MVYYRQKPKYLAANTSDMAAENYHCTLKSVNANGNNGPLWIDRYFEKESSSSSNKLLSVSATMPNVKDSVANNSEYAYIDNSEANNRHSLSTFAGQPYSNQYVKKIKSKQLQTTFLHFFKTSRPRRLLNPAFFFW